ncbi:MAG: hypothetical protein V5A84_03370 [Planctomycetota bacterium]
MKKLLASICAAALLLAVGCASPVTVAPEGPIEVGQGTVPLLRVTVGFERDSWAGRPGWGGMSQPNPRRSFARLVSAAAQEAGVMNVPEPRELKETIAAGGEKYTLDPDEEQFEAYLGILRPETYLTADLQQWQENYYTGLFQDSTVRFTLTCRRPGQSEPLWTASVNREKDYVSARELARECLRDVFERIRARRKKGDRQ